MPRTYDPEFRAWAGRGDRLSVESPGPHRPWRQAGTVNRERGGLAEARQRIKESETELALVTQAAKLFEEGCAQSHRPGHR